ncbi:fungal specific transcription factor domain-containing protein [Diaporthe amygdali]|uniref:fungal specific transcription factor domain-containing protein n=1 Tax=Phomopsis amygdali TaxID=1214568 RepID=UPI0022FE2212|nr:fungal specific transcription factor domain-containing protein [Diaporthe amygdali]KAJ0119830.1 fungal specific transcription factor domain-containing protein [Diaporthe amygdali]
MFPRAPENGYPRLAFLHCDACSGRKCFYPPPADNVPISRSKLENLIATRDTLQQTLEQAILEVPDVGARMRFQAQLQQVVDSMAPSVASTRDDEQQHMSPATSSSTLGSSPQSSSSQQHRSHQSTHTTGDADAAPTEGSLLQDHDGTKRWLGGTSGATFLDHLKNFMHTLKSALGYNETPTETAPGSSFLASRGQYQTSDSRLLYMPTLDNANAVAQISDEQAERLLFQVNKHVQSPTGQWPCGGIYYFGDLSLQGWKSAQGRELALYHAAFALGTIFSLTTANSRQDGQLGELFLATARKILGDPWDISRYSIRDVPALALMAMYMAEVNRRDNSYNYLSHAMSICCMCGGLRGLSGDEKDIRIVWTLFCLTRDVGCLMGRPPMYPDEAFQLHEPRRVMGLPSPDGLIAHVELARIAGYIVSNTYSIAPTVEADQDLQAQVQEPMNKLEKWRRELPDRLQMPLDLQAQPQIPFHDGMHDDPDELYTDRALCTLHMKCNQLIILTLRPIFFLAVKSYIGGDLIKVPRDIYDHEHISFLQECANAARRNLRLGRHILMRCNPGEKPPGKPIMMDLHHIFNAAVIMLLYQMVFTSFHSGDAPALRTAIQTFEREAQTECLSKTNRNSNIGKGSRPTGYASDCLGVLKDLTELVDRIRPLRFKEHASTSEDEMAWTNGVCLGGDEALEANLAMPFDIEGLYSPLVFPGAPPEGHTHGKVLQMWMDGESTMDAAWDVWHVI